MFSVKVVLSARRTDDGVRVFSLLGGTVPQLVELHLPPIIHFIENSPETTLITGRKIRALYLTRLSEHISELVEFSEVNLHLSVTNCFRQEYV